MSVNVVARSSASREPLKCERLAAHLRGEHPGYSLDAWTWARARARYAVASVAAGYDLVDDPLDACVWALASESSRTARVKCSACKGSRMTWEQVETRFLPKNREYSVEHVLQKAAAMCHRRLRVHVGETPSNYVALVGERKAACATCAKPRASRRGLVGTAWTEPDVFDRMRERAVRGVPTGVEDVPLAVLVLRVAANDEGSAEARSALAVAADKAQVEGDPIGEVLALWLARC